MTKEACILKVLLDGIPRALSELSSMTGLSDTYCLELCRAMDGTGAINLRKSGGTWIAWRAIVPREEPPKSIEAIGKKRACSAMNE
nr:hypothetical protein [Candidatus Sigynarchaeota archaeon]